MADLMNKVLDLLVRGEPVPAQVLTDCLAEVLIGDCPPDGRVSSLIGLMAKVNVEAPWPAIAAAAQRWRSQANGPNPLADRVLIDSALAAAVDINHALQWLPCAEDPIRFEAAPVNPKALQVAPLRQERLAALLRAPLPQSEEPHPRELARYVISLLHEHLGLDASLDEPALSEMLSGRLACAADAIDVLSAIKTPLPGFPYVLKRTARQHFFFLCRAILLSGKAAKRGVKQTPILSLPKTASSRIATVMSASLDLEVGVVSLGHIVPIKPWLEYAANYPITLHDHLAVSPIALQAFAKARTPLTFHVRDPRQIALSMAHHALEHEPQLFSEQQANIDTALEFVITTIMPELSGWLDDWLDAAAAHAIPTSLSQFTAMKDDPPACFARLLAQATSDPDALNRLSAALETLDKRQAEGAANFRKGESDEWRTVLTDKQRAAIEGQVGGTLARLHFSASDR
jgi:hypothetical protein